MGVGGQRHAPAALHPGKEPVPILGGWVGPRAGLEGCGKSRLPTGFERRTVQPVASRYTDWDIPAHDTTPIVPRNVAGHYLALLSSTSEYHNRFPSRPTSCLSTTFPVVHVTTSQMPSQSKISCIYLVSLNSNYMYSPIVTPCVL
jgi:hypothetical protein